jgi:hypothetical protein
MEKKWKNFFNFCFRSVAFSRKKEEFESNETKNTAKEKSGNEKNYMNNDKQNRRDSIF